MYLAVSVYEVTFEFEFFTTDAVETFVLSLVDIALIHQTLQESLNTFSMPRFGGPNEIIISNVKFAPEWFPR